MSGKQSKRKRFICFQDLLPRIIVKDPVTHDSWDKGKFTTYLICIKTVHPAFHLRLSAVRRRFSELLWLYKILKENHPHVHFPAPPSKKVFAEKYEPEFINARTTDIQDFLNELVVTDTVLSDSAFHFFVQTDLTTDEIDEYLNGTLSESFVKEAWQNAGHLHTSSYIVNTTTIPPEPQEITMNEEDLQVARSSTESTHGTFDDLTVSYHAVNGSALMATTSHSESEAGDVMDQTSVAEGNEFGDGVLNDVENGVVKISMAAKPV